MYGETAAENGAFADGFGEFRAKVRQRLGHPDAVFEAGAEGGVLDEAAEIYSRQRRERNELTYDAMLTDLREALRGKTEGERKAAAGRGPVTSRSEGRPSVKSPSAKNRSERNPSASRTGKSRSGRNRTAVARSREIEREVGGNPKPALWKKGVAKPLPGWYSPRQFV